MDDKSLFVKDPMNQLELEEQTRPFVFQPSMGKVIGEHQGAHFYTVGQRKGLGVGGKALPLFILETDAVNNVVYVGQGENHWALLRFGLKVETPDVHWVRSDLALKFGQDRQYMARIRYRQQLCACRLVCTETALYVIFEEVSPRDSLWHGMMAMN